MECMLEMMSIAYEVMRIAYWMDARGDGNNTWDGF